MPENMMCKTQKANSEDFDANYDRVFSRSVQEIQYPEEIRAREIERKLKRDKNAQTIPKTQ